MDSMKDPAVLCANISVIVYIAAHPIYTLPLLQTISYDQTLKAVYERTRRLIFKLITIHLPLEDGMGDWAI